MTAPQAAAKRLLDLLLSLTMLPFALPVIGIAVAAIRLESRGAGIYRQTRIGRRGRPIVVYKLRTMVENAESIGAGLYAQEGDPRFTKVGRFLRRTSLDELSQLFNVIKGDMSIVGPRPQLPLIVEQHQADYAEILSVKPGITGLAQVSGRNALSRNDRIALDKEYARRVSLLRDLLILLVTVRVVLTGEGQRNNQSREEVER
jgi:lipopolysaccharide/colanic/teichoic acid biosynthesis glycosyltransferase